MNWKIIEAFSAHVVLMVDIHFKGSLHVKYKFTLKCVKMCTDMQAINNVFQKLMYHPSEANRA
jgi:hypothetical protein